MNPIIAPSILAADFANLQRDIECINESEAAWIHVDIMDGIFVPNISFGFPVLKAISTHCTKWIDVHLMIDRPARFFETLHQYGAQGITIHAEGNAHIHSDISRIKQLGMKAGLAINPHTPISAIEPVLHLLDLVLVMSVNPGFGGQAFIPESIDKVRQANALINKKNASCLIQIDGGVGLNNAKEIIQAGADVLVAGSAVFKSADPKDTILRMKNSASE